MGVNDILGPAIQTSYGLTFFLERPMRHYHVILEIEEFEALNSIQNERKLTKGKQGFITNDLAWVFAVVWFFVVLMLLTDFDD